MIDTIIFDLAEVCVYGIIGFENKVSKYTGIDSLVIRRSLSDEKLIALFEGSISEEDYFKRFLREIGSELSVDFMKSLVRGGFVEVPGTREIIEGLRSKNYALKLGLLSDHAKEWIEYIEARHSFLSLFDAKIYSFQSGHTKLTPESFKYALKKLGSNPEKTLFIDDRSPNLEVALLAGIKHLHHFVNASALKKELANFRIYM